MYKEIFEKELLSFDDILLVPQYSKIETRKNISLNVNFNNDVFELPFISSPMSTITEEKMANEINNLGGLGILHRYNNINEQCDLLKKVKNINKKCAAIGTTGDSFERLQELYLNGLKIVCIDVAHGDHKLVYDMIEYIKKNMSDLKIIAGNISTADSYERMANLNVDAVRVSVGSGSICTTRIQTGHGVPTFQATLDCNNKRQELYDQFYHDKKMPLIISDGGIKNAGDIAKCFAAGADFVMLGSLLSGTSQTPGDIIFDENKKEYKQYNGMASKVAQKNWKGSYSSVEGVGSIVPYKGCVTKILNELKGNLKSALSYSGCDNIQDFKESCIIMKQSSNSHNEGLPHIFNKGLSCQ